MLLKDPAIVILDEATSHLDSENEAAVQSALATALDGRTAVVIAHRLSTITNADQILVVDDGRIVERGEHDDLLEADGLYADLYRTLVRSDVEPIALNVDAGSDAIGVVGAAEGDDLVEQRALVGAEQRRGRRTRAPSRRSSPTASAHARPARRTASVCSASQHHAVGVVEPQPPVHELRAQRVAPARSRSTARSRCSPAATRCSGGSVHHGATSGPMRMPSTTPMHAPSGAPQPRRNDVVARAAADRVEPGAHALGRRAATGRRSVPGRPGA